MRIRTLSVTEVTLYLKRILSNDPILSHVSVQGEISNLKLHSSGHLYFSLKDEGGRIQCVMFQGDAQGLRFMPSDGMSVIARGQISVYEREGRYQVYVRSMEPAGLGDLHLRFEALKAQLEAKGYFRMDRKKPIPRYAMCIGVVTSADSAAWRDIRSVVGRRNDAARVILCPAAVQGAQAATELAAALRTLDSLGLDVLILARGGGSIEELWAFNEEVLAHALVQLKTPVITGVGHETDFTIADFTADLRASTPSAAAELAVASKGKMLQDLGDQMKRISMLAGRRVTTADRLLQQAAPEVLQRTLAQGLQNRQDRLGRAEIRMTAAALRMLESQRHTLAMAGQRLDSSSPLKVLEKGYALVSDPQGRRISRCADVRHGDQVAVRLQDGRLDCRVEASTMEGDNG